MGFGGLGIATSGIRAAQTNLGVTAHNIANSEIPGFSRQRIVQTTSFTRVVGTNPAGIRNVQGMGTDWNAVEQIRNEFLDLSFRDNMGRLQFYSAKAQAGLVIESLLGELHGAYNFQSVINDMWHAIQELSGHPDGLETRQLLLATANSFLTKAQEITRSLVDYQYNLDSQIRVMVNDVNATVARINELNQMIRAAESSGDNANDFRDERNRALDTLSEMIPITTRIDEFGDVNISTGGTNILIQGFQNFMGLRFVSDNYGFVEPVFVGGSPTGEILSASTPPSDFVQFMRYSRAINDANGNNSGALKALMIARGNAPAHAQSINVPRPELPDFTIDNPLTGLPWTAADQAQARRDHQADVHNWNAHNWGVEFGMVPRVQMNLDRIVSTMVTMLNDTVMGYLRGTNGQFLNYEVYPEGHPQAGQPVIPDPLDIDPFTNEPRRVPIRPRDLDGSLGIPLFVRDYRTHSTDPYSFPTTSPGASPGTPADPNAPQTLFKIQNLKINPELLLDGGHNRIALSLSGGLSDTNLLEQLQNVWHAGSGPYSVQIGGTFNRNTGVFEGYRRFSVQEAYIRMTGEISTEVREAQDIVNSQTIMVEQAQNNRQRVKGVSMDEEMSSMLRFQFAFQAASRIFNVIDGMIEQVVSRTGRVGL